MVHASEGRIPDLIYPLMREAREGVHLDAVCFRDCPSSRAKGSLPRPCGWDRSGRGGVGCVHDP